MAAEYGFNPLPRNPEKILKGHTKDSPYISIDDIPVPDTKTVRAVEEYVKKELSPETYNHSVRAYYYGTITCGMN
jgi:cyanamide hydratase